MSATSERSEPRGRERPRVGASARRALAVTSTLAVGLAVAYLLLPPMGTDLSAQVARAEFFAAHGLTPIDLRWYGGVNQFAYSLVSPAVMAGLGVRITGAVALVGAAVAFVTLLIRTGAPRPLVGGLVGAVCIAGNLVSGRVTYGLGVAFGVAALLALTLPADDRRRRAVRYAAAAAAALLASATSPVAGLFVGLAGAALALTRRLTDGAVLMIAAAVPLAVTAVLFSEGGWMNISRTDAVHAVVASLAVAVVATPAPVRVGALLSAAGVTAAALFHTPVGLNATRLAIMFALPCLLAFAELPGPRSAPAARAASGRRLHRRGTTLRASSSAPDDAAARAPAGPRSARAAHAATTVILLAGLFVVGWWWQPPLIWADLRNAGSPTTDPAYFAPLRAQLDARAATGRVEVPPTRDYWESARLGDTPLARGWLRQVDIDRNPLFFERVPGAAGTGVELDADTYRDWLADNAVEYVAVPDTELSWVGRSEADLIEGGLPYLTRVWSGEDWTLYGVDAPTPIVAAPARLLRHTTASLSFEAPAAGRFPVKVRPSEALTVDNGATLAVDGDWIAVTVPGPGRYTITS